MKFIGAGSRPGQAQIHHDRVFTIPNVLTVVRFLGVPLFVWLVLGVQEYGYAALVLAIMGSTDWVDGYVARRFNQMSNLGRVMDPIADRLSLIAVAVTLVIAGVVEWWYLAALLIPDAILLALSLYYFHGHPDLPVSRIGKIRTALLLVGTPLLVLSKLPVPGAEVVLRGRLDLPGAGPRGALDCRPTTTSGPSSARAESSRQHARRRRRHPLMMWFAVLLAVLGAFCLAFGAQRQGSAVKADTGGLALSNHGMLRLIRNPRWVFGLLLLCVGMALNSVALVMAPLTVVQPIGAIALVITTIVNAKDQGLSINRATVVAISACVTGSALFVILAVNVTQENHQVSASDELTVVLLLALAVGLFGTLALVFRHRMSAFIYILGAGILFGFVAVLTRIIGKHLLDPNGLGVLNVPWYSVVAIVAAGVLGSWFVQNAYSGGPPDLVIAGLTVIDPIVGIAIGITILGELRPDVHAVTAIAMGAAALLAIVGVIALSRHHPEVTKRKKDARKAAGGS